MLVPTTEKEGFEEEKSRQEEVILIQVGPLTSSVVAHFPLLSLIMVGGLIVPFEYSEMACHPVTALS